MKKLRTSMGWSPRPAAQYGVFIFHVWHVKLPIESDPDLLAFQLKNPATIAFDPIVHPT